jgi:putative transposase
MADVTREEGLQVGVRGPRKRAGVSSIPPTEADPPNVMWAIGFQFDSTIDGKAVKIASMVEERSVERSIPPSGLWTSWRGCLSQRVGRCECSGWTTGAELVLPSATTVLRWKGRHFLHSTRHAWNKWCIESFNN